MNLSVQVADTDFYCKLCNKKMIFNIIDDSTFISKTPHQQFFGMQLTTYRVSHIINDECHINTVLVDHKGFFRGFIDAYSEKIIPTEKDSVDYVTILDETKPLREHPFFEVLLYLDLKTGWIIDIVSPTTLKIVEVVSIVVEKINDTIKIYSELPPRLEFSIADKTFNVWINDTKVFIGTITQHEKLKIIESVILGLLDTFIQENITIPQKKLLILALNITSNPTFSEKDSQGIKRLFTDDLIFAIIEVKYPYRLPRIIDRLKNDFKLSEEIISSLVTGENTPYELIENNYDKNFSEIFGVIDFINRRKLLV